jgi:prolipoprotein diacylglyceryltransferase
MSATRIQPDSRLNAWLDTTIGLAICVKGHRVGSWTALMSLGAALGSTIWVLLAYARALPTALVASLPIAVAAIAATAIRRSRSGHRVVCHRYAAVGAALVGGLAGVTSAPVLLTFDVWTVSMIAGLALGRLGCHRVGCCFGVITRIGVQYPWWIDRARHLPLALMESSWCLLLFGLGLCLLSVSRPGVTAVLLVSGYTAWRLSAQRLRDPHFRSRARRLQRILTH